MNWRGRVPVTAAHAELARTVPASRDGALYVGLMSGTSADAVDAVVCGFDDGARTHASLSYPWPSPLRERVLTLAQDQQRLDLDVFGHLDVAIGELFAEATLALLQQSGIEATRIAAIGSHGQTLRHRPDGPHPFTLQIGDPSVIAARTGIDTVADFRRADVADGGQGAPLMPAFHAQVLRSAEHSRGILNLGGIANLTVLRHGAAPLGFDVGPANCLLDAWCQRHTASAYDRDGAWAAGGKTDHAFLQTLLGDSYFDRAPPKSTGREYFHLAWLQQHSPVANMAPVDVQATLLALTVQSIRAAITAHAADIEQVCVCGGGVHNKAMMQALAHTLAPRSVGSTADLGIDPDFVEAAGFAWLARQRMCGQPLDLRSITGSRSPRLLGVVHSAAQ